MSRRGAAVHELVGWLMGATREGEFVGLPTYPDMEIGPIAADDYARRLLRELCPSDGDDALGMGLVEARAFRFRAWVETIGSPATTVAKTRSRRPEDPAGRGLNVAGALRTIAKNRENPPDEPPPELAPISPEESARTRRSRRTVAFLIGFPLVVAIGDVVMRFYPWAFGWTGLGLALLGIVFVLAQVADRGPESEP